MKYARVVKEDGSSHTDNYVLDHVMDTLNHFGISNEDEKNDELIKRLTIEKFEYGRRCLMQIVSLTKMFESEYYTKLDNELQVKITELGGEPLIKHFHNRNK